MRFVTLVVVAISVAFSIRAFAAARPCADQPGPYTLHVSTREVVIDLLATDSHGNPVRDLRAGDLTVFEVPKGAKKLARNIAAFRIVDPSQAEDSQTDKSNGFSVTAGGGCAVTTTFHYQLAFQPTSEGFAGGYHEVAVATSRPHIHLSFHRRYYVGETLDSTQRVHNNGNVDTQLRQAACVHALTPLSIGLKARAIQTAATDPLRFALTIQPNSLGFASLTDENRSVHLDYAVCAFDQQGQAVSYNSYSAERVLSASEYERVQSAGFSNLLDLPRKGEPALVRFVVRDRETGNLGSIDVPTTPPTEIHLTKEQEAAAKKFEVNQARKSHVPPADPSAGFGSVIPKPDSLCGDVYELAENTPSMPENFWDLEPVGAIYAYALNEEFQYVPNGLPGITVRPEWFAIDYHGKFWISEAGKYTFVLTADDGQKLVIDDQQLLYDDHIHTALTTSRSIQLAAGTHTIRIAYFQGPARTALKLEVKPPGKALRLFDLREFAAPKTEAARAVLPASTSGRPSAGALPSDDTRGER
jgi:hypothetical protein